MNTAVADQQIQISLPPELFQQLQAEAERQQQAAGTLAQQAIESWLKIRREELIDAEIAAYAERFGGTDVDLDEELMEASLEFLSNCDDVDYIIDLPTEGANR